jgi:hypothetical protein
MTQAGLPTRGAGDIPGGSGQHDRRAKQRAVLEARQPARYAGRQPGTKEAREVRSEGFGRGHRPARRVSA